MITERDQQIQDLEDQLAALATPAPIPEPVVEEPVESKYVAD